MTGYVDGAATFGDAPLAAQGLDAFAAVYLDTLDAAPALADVFAIGGPDADRGYGVAIGGYSDGMGFLFPIVVTGSFRGEVAFADSIFVSAGSNDVFMASLPACPAYSCPLIVAVDAGLEGAVRLSAAPNPSVAGARLSLTLDAASDATVEVVDALGRVVARMHGGPLAAGETAWTAPRLAPAPTGSSPARTAGRSARPSRSCAETR